MPLPARPDTLVARDPLFRVALTGTPTVAALAALDPRPLAQYRAVAGDTLAGIAVRFYGPGQGDLGALIQRANGLTDPRVPPVGLVLTIPAPGWRAY